jgi:hypothetical protein
MPVAMSGATLVGGCRHREQAKPRSFGQSVEESRVVLGNIMVLRPLPKAFGVSLVVMERTGGDIFQIAGREPT